MSFLPDFNTKSTPLGVQRRKVARFVLRRSGCFFAPTDYLPLYDCCWDSPAPRTLGRREFDGLLDGAGLGLPIYLSGLLKV